jgi:hypothetical protein
MVHNRQNTLQRKNSTRLGLIVSLALISLLGCYGFRFLPEDPDWKTYKSGEFGFSFECPYHMELKTSDFKDKKGNYSKRIIGFASHQFSFFELLASSLKKKYPGSIYFSVWSQIADNKNLHFDLKKMAEMFKKSPSWTAKSTSYKNFQANVVYTKCSGIPAAMITTTYDFCGKNGKLIFTNHTIRLLAVRGGQYWSADSSYSGDEKFYIEMANRMINSFKIIPQTTPAPKNTATP